MLVAFDGLDGAGKSTQLEMFIEFLDKHEIENYFFDMGGFEHTKKYLYKLKHNEFNCSAELRELLYYYEDRLFSDFYLENYCSDNKIAICDRWLLTYLSYGKYNGIPAKEIQYFTEKLIRPDLYFYIDITPEDALKRIKRYRNIDKAEIGYKNQLSSNENTNESKYLEVQKETNERDNYFCCETRRG